MGLKASMGRRFHHQIHHAINPEYIGTKISGGILTVGDRIFGTFKSELSDVQPPFGITRPAQTWNRIKINFCISSCLSSDASAYLQCSLTSYGYGLFKWDGVPADAPVKIPCRLQFQTFINGRKTSSSSIYLKVWAWDTTPHDICAVIADITADGLDSQISGLRVCRFIFLSVHSYTHAWIGRVIPGFLIAMIDIFIHHHALAWRLVWLNTLVPTELSMLPSISWSLMLVSLAFAPLEFRKTCSLKRQVRKGQVIRKCDQLRGDLLHGSPCHLL
ncbi:MAG: hypothetical protein IPP17_29020 [Bacteroidetes bacterium]|nr:hypothetical protein [Bacteroidota bacterium]